ncbi:MAG: S41 family peptidase [Fulvivirga sp.]|uniref:S41 family peptidase n=1 Tax=Fulvivirga sp. TaxID=1931237 RepID=UPI0032ED6C40
MKAGLVILLTFITLVVFLATWSYEPEDESVRFVSNQDYISKKAAILDLLEIVSSFEQIHPNPYRFRSKAVLLEEISSYELAISDSLTIIEFWRIVDKLICGYNDAHSVADDAYVLTDYVKNGGLFFPYSVELSNGQIRFESSNSLTRRLVRSINGIESNELIKTLKLHATKETNELDEKDISDDFGFYYWKAFGRQEAFEIISSDDSILAKYDTIKVEGISWEQRKGKSVKDSPSYSFKFLQDSIGYMTIKDFNGSESDINDFYKQSFQRLKDAESKSLILDFRGHSGGSDSYGELLAKYISDQKFRKLSKAYWKITKDFKEAFDRRFVLRGIRWFKPIYLVNEYSAVFYDADFGETIEIEYELRNTYPDNERFSGHVYLLTDHDTFSAGSIFAEMFKYYKMGTLVGQPTGNLQSFNGFALVSKTLPNSKLTYKISSVYNLANSQFEGLKSVQPDVLLQDDQDPVLYLLQNSIR